MSLNDKRRYTAVNKELLSVEKQEKKLQQAAMKAKPAVWKKELESRLPEKTYNGLESTFCKGFSLVFNQGRALIEKGYNREELQANYSIRDYAVQVKGGRKELKQMRKSARHSDLLNLAVTTVEGVGLGALGVGMPDIVLFLTTLLKGIYETALNYGFDYETRPEQLLILKMMETALSTGERWRELNGEVETLMNTENTEVTEEEFEAQLKATSSAFAVDMLLLKFIQGLPVVGIIGGAANPVYYTRILEYVETKYRKRYLLKQKAK